MRLIQSQIKQLPALKQKQAKKNIVNQTQIKNKNKKKDWKTLQQARRLCSTRAANISRFRCKILFIHKYHKQKVKFIILCLVQFPALVPFLCSRYFTFSLLVCPFLFSFLIVYARWNKVIFDDDPAPKEHAVSLQNEEMSRALIKWAFELYLF